MMRTAALVILLTLAGCSPVSPTAAVSPSAGGMCRLPVAIPALTPEQQAGGMSPTTYKVGIITVPGGDLTLDPDGGFNLRDYLWTSATLPVLRGTSVGYYDRAFHRWLPADRTQVSPDESHYAYFLGAGVEPGDTRGYVHVVDVATGRDRTLGAPLDTYRILAFGKDGIYFIYGPPSEMAPTPDAGLWLMEPNSGSIRRLFNDGWVHTVSGDVAWVMASDMDPHPTGNYPDSEVGPPNPPVVNLLLRRDLRSGSIQRWLYRPGFNVLPMSSYGAQVMVWVNKPGSNGAFNEYLMVSGPESATKLNSSVNLWATVNAGLGFADSNGIWLGGDAIYLYTARSGLQKVAGVKGFPSSACL